MVNGDWEQFHFMYENQHYFLPMYLIVILNFSFEKKKELNE